MSTLANEHQGWIAHDGAHLEADELPPCCVDLKLRNGCVKHSQNSELVSWKWNSPSSTYRGFDIVAYRVCKEPEKEEEHKWIDWDYREPLRFDYKVDVEFQDGGKDLGTLNASTYGWQKGRVGSIIKWRLHNDGSVPISVLNAAADAAMRGYTPWLGGENPLGSLEIETIFANGEICSGPSSEYDWSSYIGLATIVGYKVLEVLEEVVKKEVEYEIPEGYILANAKKPDLPGDTLIMVMTIGDFKEDGSQRKEPWGEPAKVSFYDFDHTLIAYKVVFSEAKAGEISEPSANTNPKQAYGDSKLPVGLVSPIFVANVSLAKLNGKLKYGGANYIGTQVVLSTYLHAIQRHLFAFSLGEEFDPIDGVPHLGAIGASIDIILSAKAAGTLIDDRLRCDGQLEAIEALLPIVASLKQLHKDKNPKHYLMTEK